MIRVPPLFSVDDLVNKGNVERVVKEEWRDFERDTMLDLVRVIYCLEGG